MNLYKWKIIGGKSCSPLHRTNDPAISSHYISAVYRYTVRVFNINL